MMNKSKVVSGYLYNLILQGGNYIFPILTIPIVSSTFGPKLIGDFSYLTTIVSFCSLIIEYGFNYTGVRRISRNKDGFNHAFNYIFQAKLLIFTLVTFSFFLFVCFFNLNGDRGLIVSCYTFCFMSLFNVTWFLQSFGDFKLITLFSLITKTISFLGIFFFVKERNDLVLYSYIVNISLVIGSLLGFFYAVKRYRIKFYLIPKLEIASILKSDFWVFFSKVSASLYTSLGVVMLGLLSNTYQVGIYTSAQKVVTLFINFSLVPLTTVLFPLISERFGKSKEDGVEFFKMLVLPLLIFSILTTLLFLVAGRFFIIYLMGVQFAPSVHLLYVQSVGYFFLFWGVVIGGQLILNMKYDRDFVLIQLVVAFISLSLNLFFLRSGGGMSLSIIWTLSEFFMTSLQVLFLYRVGVNIFSKDHLSISCFFAIFKSKFIK